MIGRHGTGTLILEDFFLSYWASGTDGWASAGRSATTRGITHRTTPSSLFSPLSVPCPLPGVQADLLRGIPHEALCCFVSDPAAEDDGMHTLEAIKARAISAVVPMLRTATHASAAHAASRASANRFTCTSLLRKRVSGEMEHAACCALSLQTLQRHALRRGRPSLFPCVVFMFCHRPGCAQGLHACLQRARPLVASGDKDVWVVRSLSLRARPLLALPMLKACVHQKPWCRVTSAAVRRAQNVLFSPCFCTPPHSTESGRRFRQIAPKRPAGGCGSGPVWRLLRSLRFRWRIGAASAASFGNDKV